MLTLKKFSYKEYEVSPRHWELLEFELGAINLIVGNNSSGKSRTLNVISGLSKLLLHPKIQYNSGTYSACFANTKGANIQYLVEYRNGAIAMEKFILDNEELINRNEKGEGMIFNQEVNKSTKFKIPKNELAVTRRDEFQYPYLEDLYLWAKNTRHFRFSKEQEKQTLALISSNKKLTEEGDSQETNQVIEVFRKANGKYRKKFVEKVIEDFNSIGYSISKVDTGVLQSIQVDSPVGNKVVGIRVQERDRLGITDQNEMSDGMFRALSVIIHYNYYALEGKKLNILIDDIGEGLDFDRSTKLIKLLIEKSNSLGLQLIMSTNDKFVMNNTNLEYWQIISRNGGIVKMFNKSNSLEKFEDFKFTGLNNFDFYITDFFKAGLE